MKTILVLAAVCACAAGCLSLSDDEQVVADVVELEADAGCGGASVVDAATACAEKDGVCP